MKRNVSFIVLAIEIAAIVVLHANKVSTPETKLNEQNSQVSKMKAAPVSNKQYTLLSIK
ncbi:MAG: hypothetical protein H7Y27_05820 [Gemmatimonadaceae bacterium]|nr:hypothetical protein [Chitinophagaceae bacterium]